MNTKYCPHCGSKHSYLVDKPKTCVKCNKDMNQIFNSATTQNNIMPSSQTTYVPPTKDVHPARRFMDMRNTDSSLHDEESDYVDKREVEFIAQQLAATIKPEDFGISAIETENKSSKLSDLIKVLPPASSNTAPNTKKRRSRK